MAQLNLENGAVYRGRICIHHSNWTIDNLGGGTNKIRNTLLEQGFSSVSVWREGQTVPADWPAAAKSKPAKCVDACVWIEGVWGKETGMYPHSGDDAAVFDYWMYKAAPKAQPPVPPPCKNIGDVCAVHGDCCSQNCAGGVCVEQQGAPPPPANVTCGWYGVDCSNLNCCEGLTCQQDTAGDLGGGMRCITAPAQTDVPPGPGEPITLGLAETPKPSDWWYAAGAAAVVGIGWLVLNKMYLRVPATNPTERKAYRVIFDKPAPLNLVNKLIAKAREKKLQIDMPRLDVSVDLIFVKAKDGAGSDLVRRRFAEAWRETLTAEFEERWGKEWYLRGGRDEYLPEFMKY